PARLSPLSLHDALPIFLGQSVTLHTNLGDIKIEVFCEAVPVTAYVSLAPFPSLLLIPSIVTSYTPFTYPHIIPNTLLSLFPLPRSEEHTSELQSREHLV